MAIFRHFPIRLGAFFMHYLLEMAAGDKVPEAGVEASPAKIAKDSVGAFLDFTSENQKSRCLESFGVMENLCAFV